MRTIGIDLSLTGTGLAAVEQGGCWVHRVGATGLTAITDLSERVNQLAILGNRIASAVLDANDVDLVLIETPALSRSRGGVYERGYVWYHVVRLLAVQGVRVAGVDPGQLKLYATGRGNASKGEVVDAVARRWPQFPTRGDDNLADAAVLAAMAADLLDAPLCAMPAANRKALTKIKLPTPTDLQLRIPEAPTATIERPVDLVDRISR